MDEKRQDQAAEQARQDGPLHQDVTFGPALSDERAAEVMARNEAQLKKAKLEDFRRRIQETDWADGIERSRANNPLYCGPVHLEDLQGKQFAYDMGTGAPNTDMTDDQLEFFDWARTTLGTRQADSNREGWDDQDIDETKRYDLIREDAQSLAIQDGIKQEYGLYPVFLLNTDRPQRPRRHDYYANFYELTDRQAVDLALQRIRTEAAAKQRQAEIYDLIRARIYNDGSEYAEIPKLHEQVLNLSLQVYKILTGSDLDDGDDGDPDLWIYSAAHYLYQVDPTAPEDHIKEILDKELQNLQNDLKAAQDDLKVAPEGKKLRESGFAPLLDAIELSDEQLQALRPDVSRTRIGIDTIEEWRNRHPDQTPPKNVGKRLKKEILGIAAEICKKYARTPEQRQTLTDFMRGKDAQPEVTILAMPTDNLNMMRTDRQGNEWAVRTTLDNYGEVRSMKMGGTAELQDGNWVAIGMRWDRGRMDVPNDDGIELTIRSWRYAEVSLALFIYNKVLQARKAGQTWYEAREYDLLSEWKGSRKLRRDKKTRERLFNMVSAIAKGEINVDLKKICDTYGDNARIELAKWGIDPDNDVSGYRANIEKFRLNDPITTKEGVDSTTYVYSFGSPPMNILIGIIQGKYTLIPKDRTGLIRITAEELSRWPVLQERARAEKLLDSEGGITIAPTEEVMGMQYHVQAQLYLRCAYGHENNPRIFLDDLYKHSFFEEPSKDNKITMRKNVERYLIALVVRGWVEYTDYKDENNPGKKSTWYFELQAPKK